MADALELARENVRRSKFDPDIIAVNVDVPESIVVEIARHQIVMALAITSASGFETMGKGFRTKSSGDCCSLHRAGAANRSAKSMGYGLPLAARNLAAHGGTLAVESVENEGTVVTIVLPEKSR